MTTEPFAYRYRVRYIDCDMQRVVYNSHYLTFCDDCIELWMRTIGLNPLGEGWDFMLKHAEITWTGSAAFADTVTIVPSVAHWGRTSFTVAYAGSIDEREIFTARITYVSVVPGTTETLETPAVVRELLGAAAHA